MRDTQAAVKRGGFVLFGMVNASPRSFVMSGAGGDVTKWGCVPPQMLRGGLAESLRLSPAALVDAQKAQIERANTRTMARPCG